MVKPPKALRKQNMQMFYMLPKEGMHYGIWVEEVVTNKKTRKEYRILPPNMSTKIMLQFFKKHNEPTRKAFDRAIAELFDKATAVVYKLSHEGKNPSYQFTFWNVPKLGTFLEKVSDTSTSHFAAKMLEGRDGWLGKDEPPRPTPNRDAANYECETAKAIDRFNEAVKVASVMRNGMEAVLGDAYPESVDFGMAAYMVGMFDSEEDTDSPDDDDDDEEPTDDEAPAAKRVKIEMPPTTDGEAGPHFALDVNTTPLAIRVRASEALSGANKTDAKETDGMDAYLAQMAKEDEAQLDEEDLMEMDGY